MKHLTIAMTLLILTACSSDSSYKKADAKKAEAIDLLGTVNYVAEQYLKVQEVELHVKTVRLEENHQSTRILTVIQSPTQKLGYSFDLKTRELNYPLSEALNQFVQEQKTAPISLDFNIVKYRKIYYTYNRLQIDRCRTVPVWKELKAMVEGERHTLYFDISNLTKTNFLLKWNLESKTFKGFAKTPPNYSAAHGSVDGISTVISPVVNPADTNGDLTKDSAFLNFWNFATACDYSYSPAEAPGNPDFLPRFKSDWDIAQSNYLSGLTLAKTVFDTENLYALPVKITSEDVVYVEQTQNLTENVK